MSDGPINVFKNAKHCVLNTLDFKPALHWIAYPRPYRFELLEGETNWRNKLVTELWYSHKHPRKYLRIYIFT